ncbi:MAG: hypothetical protein WDN46_04990 [Methylocella sp.]
MNDESKRNLAKWDLLIEEWRAAVAPLGLTVEQSTADYEIAKVKGEGVSLVIYPFVRRPSRSSTPRIRNNGSKDMDKARAAHKALGLWCRNIGFGMYEETGMGRQ